MLVQSRYRGFTLIELLMGLVIVGILMFLGAPALGTYLQNAKVSNAAATYYTAVQTARTEAIRRNVAVQFVLTDSTGTAATLATGAVPNPNGANWVVRAASGAASSATFEAVEAKSGAESAGGGIQIAASGPAGFDGTIAFNGFGAMPNNQPYSIDFTNPTAGTCAAASGPIRCRRIVISSSGRIAACDPAAGVGDSRAC